MDLCIKTDYEKELGKVKKAVSILVNGSMYKNYFISVHSVAKVMSFNPCFNGSMYKNNEENE